ncbi:MAG: ABC transporter substrate-binding protein [Alphaproteobacteria bacterium]
MRILAAGFATMIAVSAFGAHYLQQTAIGADNESVTPANEAEVRDFMEALVGTSIQLLSDLSVPQTEREKRFQALLVENFDIDAISGFILARSWRSATQEQRNEFKEIFVRAVAQRFVPVFEDYEGDALQVSGVRVDAKRPRVAEAEISIPYGENNLAKTSWRVYHKENGTYKIIDAKVEGVSMTLSLRQEYASIIRRDGVDGLLDLLREKYSGS